MGENGAGAWVSGQWVPRSQSEIEGERVTLRTDECVCVRARMCTGRESLVSVRVRARARACACACVSMCVHVFACVCACARALACAGGESALRECSERLWMGVVGGAHACVCVQVEKVAKDQGLGVRV